MDLAWWVPTALSAVLWCLILFLPWWPWACREVLEPDESGSNPDLSVITVLVPARNEEKTIGMVLHGLTRQGQGLRIILIDDESSDATKKVARAAGSGITVIDGSAPPEGWSGKLWALEQGRVLVRTPFTLLLDADIELRPGILDAILKKMRRHNLAMTSLMAAPNMSSFWEKAVMPAFVYFFKLLYPFALSNRGGTGVAAAAGGCILLRTRILDEIGGFSSIRGALIDDCALALRVKSAGRRIWLGLTHAAISRRSAGLAELGNMVARTAFTQLRFSALLLAGCTALLTLAFLVPPAGLFLPGGAFALSLIAMLVMGVSYLPVLEFYGRSRLWSLVLPLIAAWYLAMTWLSAYRYWKGERSRWKGRSYARSDSGLTV